MSNVKNNYQALVGALKLAIDAPSDEQQLRAVALAEEFAATLSEFEVARAKREIEKEINNACSRLNEVLELENSDA